MQPTDLLRIPVRLFWFLSKNIDRIQADNDLRLFNLNLVVASASGEGAKEAIEGYRNGLIEQRGEVIREEQVASAPDDILAFTNL